MFVHSLWILELESHSVAYLLLEQRHTAAYLYPLDCPVMESEWLMDCVLFPLAHENHVTDHDAVENLNVVAYFHVDVVW